MIMAASLASVRSIAGWAEAMSDSRRAGFYPHGNTQVDDLRFDDEANINHGEVTAGSKSSRARICEFIEKRMRNLRSHYIRLLKSSIAKRRRLRPHLEFIKA
jgi:hypothetical protein